MRTMVLLAALVAAGCGNMPTAPEPVPDKQGIDWPVREWRDTVIIFDTKMGENMP